MLGAEKGGEEVLALTADDDRLEAAAQLIMGAAAIYDGSDTSISGSQVTFSFLSHIFLHLYELCINVRDTQVSGS